MGATACTPLLQGVQTHAGGARIKVRKMAKKLLREYYELCDGGVCQDLLTEEEKRMVAGGAMILTGICQKANVQNGNLRIYTTEILRREVENYQSLIQQNRDKRELSVDLFNAVVSVDFSKCQGVKRRQEVLLDNQMVTILSDFAQALPMVSNIAAETASSADLPAQSTN